MKVIYDVIAPSGLRCSRIARSAEDATADYHGRLSGIASQWLTDANVSDEVRGHWQARLADLNTPPEGWYAARQPLRRWPVTLYRMVRGI